MNACGHHHVGNIGILGVDKKGEEFYQVSLGGSSKHDASLAKIMGPAFAQEEIPEVVCKAGCMSIRISDRNKKPLSRPTAGSA
jgi:sulfite reductase (NADPH) hemoprotein beta-component